MCDVVVDVIVEVKDGRVGHGVDKRARYPVPNEVASVNIMRRCDKSWGRKGCRCGSFIDRVACIGRVEVREGNTTESGETGGGRARGVVMRKGGLLAGTDVAKALFAISPTMAGYRRVVDRKHFCRRFDVRREGARQVL